MISPGRECLPRQIALLIADKVEAVKGSSSSKAEPARGHQGYGQAMVTCVSCTPRCVLSVSNVKMSKKEVLHVLSKDTCPIGDEKSAKA